MAYQPMFTMGGGMDMLGGTNPFETEEERRRREQQEAMARGEIPSGPVAPQPAPALTESEVTPGYQAPRPQPFKQTLTTDPVTGQQTMKMSGDPRDFTAANPFTPTVTPVSPDTGPTPDEIMRDQEQRRQYQQMMAQPSAIGVPANELGLPASETMPMRPQGPAQPPMAVAPLQLAQAPGTRTDAMPAMAPAPQPPAAPAAPPPAPPAQPVPPGMAVNQETGDLYTPTPAAPAQPAAAAAPPPPQGGPVAQPPLTQPAGQAQAQMMAQDIQEGPTARTMAVEWGQIANLNRNSPEKLFQLARAESTPPRWQRIYSDMAAERFRDERNRRQGEADANDAVASGRGVSRILDRKPPEMSAGWFARMYLLRAFGFEKLYENELAKITKTYEDIDVDGTIYTLERRGDGLVSNLFDPEGQPLSKQEINQVASRVGGIEGVSAAGGRGGGFQKGEFMVDEEGMPFQTAFNPKNPRRPIVTPIGHNAKPTGRLVRSTQSPGLAADIAASKKTVDLEWNPLIRAAETSAEELTKAGIRFGGPGVNLGVQRDAQNRTVIVDRNNNNQVVTPDASGRISVVRTPGVGAGGTAQAEKEVRLQTVEAEENIKSNSAIANDAAKKARQTPGQLTTLDRVIAATQNSPQFFGEWIGGDAFRAFRDAKTSAEERDALNRLAQLASIRDPKERERFQSLMNDIRRLELDGITGSGLSAQQLNTPPESERAVRAFAVSITDSAKAAQAQALIARATVEYNREFNRFMATANKRLSPAALQDEFNAKTGDQIFRDLQRKLGIRDYTGGAR